MSTVTIQGYALPWRRTAIVDGIRETVAAYGVDISGIRNHTLIFGDHETGACFAQTRNGSLRMFRDSYGLAFEATVPTSQQGVMAAARMIAEGQVCQASVNFACFADYDEAGGRRTIRNALIDHIAVVSEAVYGSDTACWLQETPMHRRAYQVSALAERWEESNRHQATRQATAVPSRAGQRAPRGVSTCRPSASRKMQVPPSVAVLVDRIEREGWHMGAQSR